MPTPRAAGPAGRPEAGSTADISGSLKFERLGVDDEIALQAEQDVEAGIARRMPQPAQQILLDLQDLVQIAADVMRNGNRDQFSRYRLRHLSFPPDLVARDRKAARVASHRICAFNRTGLTCEYQYPTFWLGRQGKPRRLSIAHEVSGLG